MLEVLAPDLDRVIQNALLYTNKKALRLREVLVEVAEGKLSVFACDDYIAVVDVLEIPDQSVNKSFSLGVDVVEELGEWIKKDKKVVHKSKLKLSFFNTYVKIKDEENEIRKSEYLEPADEWDLVKELLDLTAPGMMIPDFAVRPDRFAKIARLKADKEAPLMFRGIDINGHLVLQFKKGRSLVGAAMPIRQEYIDEEFLWNNEHTEASLSSTSTESAQSYTD